MALQNESQPRRFGDLFELGYWKSETKRYSDPTAEAGGALELDTSLGLEAKFDMLIKMVQEQKMQNQGGKMQNLERNCEPHYGQHFTEQCPLLDSYFRDQQSNRMSDYSQQLFQSSNQWSSYPQGDRIAKFLCNPRPCMFSAEFSKKWVESRIGDSFEDTVMQKLNALQEQMQEMALQNLNEFERTRSAAQTDVMLLTMNLESKFVEHLKAYEERSVKRFEEHSKKMSSMLERLESQKRENLKEIQKNFEDLKVDTEYIALKVQSLENRMECQMKELYTGMFKAQGRFEESESDDDWFEDQDLKELPGYNCETISEYYGNDSMDGVPTTGAVHEHWMNLEGIREEDYMACSLVEERNYSIGAELPLYQDDTSLSSPIKPCYSCEIVGALQVNACFGVIASSASRNKSQEEASWEDKDSMVDFEVPKKTCKKKKASGCTSMDSKSRIFAKKLELLQLEYIQLGRKCRRPQLKMHLALVYMCSFLRSRRFVLKL